jgi:hypothetical protein
LSRGIDRLFFAFGESLDAESESASYDTATGQWRQFTRTVPPEKRSLIDDNPNTCAAILVYLSTLSHFVFPFPASGIDRQFFMENRKNIVDGPISAFYIMQNVKAVMRYLWFVPVANG